MKDKAGVENVIVDHLSKFIVKSQEAPLNNVFPNEHLLAISMEQAPWLGGIANYLTSGIPPHVLSSYQKKKFFHDIKMYF